MSGSRLQGRLWRLCQKELKETIRDRRTIVTLVLMPLLVYPLLSMGLNRFLLTSAGTGGPDPVYTIGLQSDAEGYLMKAWLEDPRSRPPQAILDASDGALAEFSIVITYEQTPSAALEQNSIDVGAKIAMTTPPTVTFIAFAGDEASEMCQRVLTERMQWLRLGYAESVAARNSPDFMPPATVSVQDVGEAPAASALATIVPLVLVLMTITGAVYPAIDLTAGERERGTMESLMASPVPRFYVLFAKYTAVVTVALLTAIANLAAMFTTLWASRLLPLLTGGDEAFPWLAILQILGLLILFSGFYSAVLLSLTSFAKSFKEAQAYLIPVMLLSLAPGMLSVMPGVSLSGPMAIAPLVNIVLLAREVLAGSVPPAAALAAVISTAAYAAAALAIAAKLFGGDAVQRTSDQSIGSIFHRPLHESEVPSPQAAALMLATLVPVYFVVSNVLIRIVSASRESLSISTQLVLNAVALIATFGLVPLLATYYGRSRYRTTYRFERPCAVVIVGAILVGLGAWAIAHEAFVLADAMGIGGIDEDRIRETLGNRLDAFTKAPPWLLVACLALTPAIIEELCFRGFLFSSLSKVVSPGRVIVITSLIFGLFHVLTGNALLLERFVPTTLLGLVLGWIAYRTGSVIPGMVMHFVHNALLELVAHYHKRLDFLGGTMRADYHLPTSWLMIATSIAIIGLVVVWLGTRKPLLVPGAQTLTT
jgi:ABC-2 type transport system permease protein/sodium transport system permease protein